MDRFDLMERFPLFSEGKDGSLSEGFSPLLEKHASGLARQ